MEKKQPTRDAAAVALRDFQRILDARGIIFYLDGGTLLGAYRDGKFCEDDHDDIDLTTFEAPTAARIHDILEDAAEAGFAVYHFWRKTPTTTAQLSVERGGVKIDLMFKERRHKKVWWTVWRGRVPTHKAVKALYFSSDRAIAFAESIFRGPAFIEEYLEARYGDWKTPVHRRDYSCYSTDRCIVRGGYDAI